MAEQSFKVDGGIEAVGIITASTFAKIGGTSSQFLKADGSVDVGVYKTTDTNTQYTISAADHTSNKKLLRLNDGSSNNDIILSGGDNITLSRVGDEVSIAGTDTTYDLDVIDGSGNKKNINLVSGGSGIGSTSFVLNPGNNIGFTRTGNEITITGTDTNTNTTYTYAAIDGNSADEKILRVTSSGGVDDDITLVAGSNISLTKSGERITFTGTDTDTTYSQSAVADGSGNVNIRLTAGGSGSGDDDILVTAGNNITIDSIGPNGFRIASASVSGVPTGLICIWSGAANAIPSGWVLCDGNNSTPNLSGKFVVGYSASDNDYDVGDTGGNKEQTLSTNQIPSHTHGDGNYSTDNTGNHSHGAGNYGTNSTGNHSHNLSGNTSNTGAHTHGILYADSDSQDTPSTNLRVSNQVQNPSTYSTTSSGGHSHNISGNTSNTGAHSHNVTGNSGNTGAHSHNVTGSSGSTGGGSSFDNRPPYYALCYIMKT